jgi:hypothetical protein
MKPRPSRKKSHRFYPRSSSLSDNPRIALAGTRVMNRMRVEGTALVRHAEVACWVMSPEDQALTEVAR